jgi:dihydropteroate synthase
MENQKYSNSLSINCKGILYQFTTPKIMGIINCTPDSFYEKSRISNIDQVRNRVEKMIEEGVDIIDIGGASTRPGAEFPSVKEERDRVIPIIKNLVKTFPKVLFSIDTMSGEIAKEAIDNGIHLINDVSGGELDSSILRVASENKVPYVLTHSPGFVRATIPFDADSFMLELLSHLAKKVAHCRNLGVTNLIIDPGFGFSKTVDQNFEIIQKFEMLHIFECPLLVGISRKSMIYKTLNLNPSDSLNGTTILNTILCNKGASIVRVHDVKEMFEIRSLSSRC